MKYRQFPQHLLAFGLSLLAMCLALPALASDRGEGQLDPSQPTGITVEEIIQRFAAKEKQFKLAREQYTYRQSVTVQTLEGDTVDGEYKQVDESCSTTKASASTRWCSRRSPRWCASR